jgi:hypothetical protein
MQTFHWTVISVRRDVCEVLLCRHNKETSEGKVLLLFPVLKLSVSKELVFFFYTIKC